jgi:hypothetical protein
MVVFGSVILLHVGLIGPVGVGGGGCVGPIGIQYSCHKMPINTALRAQHGPRFLGYFCNFYCLMHKTMFYEELPEEKLFLRSPCTNGSFLTFLL